MTPRTPMGALRILSRLEGAEILILRGEDRPLRLGEKLAQIHWFASEPIAASVSQYCSHLLDDAKMSADDDGWHPFAELHVRNLIAVAKTHMHVDETPSAVIAPARPRAWTGERIARLGFLAGLGWSAKKIADDQLILSTPNNVYRQAHRFGVALSEAPQGQIRGLRLPTRTLAILDRAAATMKLQRDALAQRLLIAAAANPDFVELLEG